MSGFDRYDAIVIGGGHNGLVTAYLARAGKKVCVLERRHVLGGCANSEELWPGYKVSTAAYVVGLMESQVMADLRLAEKAEDSTQESLFIYTIAGWPKPNARSGHGCQSTGNCPV